MLGGLIIKIRKRESVGVGAVRLLLLGGAVDLKHTMLLPQAISWYLTARWKRWRVSLVTTGQASLFLPSLKLHKPDLQPCT
jgi:hypothetical protein